MTQRESKFASYSSTFEQKSSSSSSSTNMITTQNGNSIMNDHCARCSYFIYPLEMMGSIKGQKYHRTCFKCHVCDRQLDLKTFQTNQIDLNDINIYCSSHSPKNGKGTIGFTSSRSNSPAVQHKAVMNKSKSQDSLDLRLTASPNSNEIHQIKVNQSDLKNNEEKNKTTTVTIPVVISKTDSTSNVSSPAPTPVPRVANGNGTGKLNEIGTKLIELSKSNVDLNYNVDLSYNDDDHEVVYINNTRNNQSDKNTSSNNSRSSSKEPSHIIIRYENESDAVNSRDYMNDPNTYSPNVIRELYLYDHEIDQLIKDLEENKQPSQFMNLNLLSHDAQNGSTLDSVLDKGVVVTQNSPAVSDSSSYYQNHSQQQQQQYHQQNATSSISTSQRVQNSASVSTSQTTEAAYHSSINNNVTNRVHFYIDQATASAQNNTDNKHLDRQNSIASSRQPYTHQSSIDYSVNDKKYVSVLMPSLKDPQKPKQDEIIVINPDESSNKLEKDKNPSTFIQVISSGVTKPETDHKMPPFNHSISNHSNHSNRDPPFNNSVSEHSSHSNHITIRPTPMIDPENTIVGENNGLGAIKLTVYYDELRNRLSITLHQAQNLKNLDKSKKTVSDPYVRVYLLPDDKQKSLKRKTRVVKNNLNPKWEETFDYTMSFSTAESKDLVVNLKDERGLFQKAEDCFMGEVLLRLKNIDIQKQYTRWFYLQPMNAVSKLLLSSGIRPYS